MDLILKQNLGSNFYADSYIGYSPENTPVLYRVKVIKPKFADKGMSNYLRQQLSYMAQLDIFDETLPELIETNNSLSLKYPFAEQQTLARYLKRNKTLSIPQTLQLSIALSDCLAHRHQNSWIHKSLKPNNILYCPDTGKVSLLDDLAVITTHQLGKLVADEAYCEESLAYQSPEQCGRVRLDVDYRTDLYSLGCVLYHCIAGHPPFWGTNSTSNSSQEIIHSHLAEIPEALSQLPSQQPSQGRDQCEALNHIIATLLEKETEKRYQTAQGLKNDLLTCKQKWENKDQTLFPLKRTDIRDEIVLPSILLGRQRETEDLLSLYKQVCDETLGVAYVTGLSGIGKSRLVQELEVPILLRQGLFASGKYNQFSKHQPYATIAQGIGKLVRFILTETEQRLQVWRKEILAVVGINGQLLTAVIPELALLIGEQPEVNPLPPVEARNRFNDLFCRFMMCLATKEHPFVLFIDDLQWCDDATLDVLDQLLAHPEQHPYLLLILAFRSNEVNNEHRIHQTRRSLIDNSTPLLGIDLAELDKPTVDGMVAYILGSSSEETADITDAIHPTCGGNPLLINESLRWLHQHQGIFHDKHGRWRWDEKALGTLQLPEGYLALFSDKLERLTADSRDILGCAALLGARFKTDDLAVLFDITASALITRLSEALAQHIVTREDDELYFGHDQIQMAAATVHNPERVKAIHKQISERLIEQFNQASPQDSEQAQRLYSIAEHLKKCRWVHASNEDNFTEATFNQLAGEAALNALAHSAADYYFSEALSLCNQESWLQNYDFMLTLYKNYARSALLVGEQSRSNKTINIAMKQAKNDLDRADCLLAQVVATTSLGNIEEGIALGFQCSQLLESPIATDEEAVESEVARHTTILQDRENLTRYQELPRANDKKVLIELALYAELLASFYVSGRVNLVFLASMRSVVLALQYGKSDATVFSFGVVGSYFHLQQESSLAQQYEEVLLNEVELSPYEFGSIRAITQALWLSLHHTRSLSDMTKLCRTNIERGIRAGELNYTGLTYIPLIWLTLEKCDDLEELKYHIRESLDYCEQYAISQPLEISRAIENALMPLWGELPAQYDETVEQNIRHWHEGEHVSALYHYYFMKARLTYHQSNYAEAEDALILAQQFLVAVPGTLIERLWSVYRYLCGLQTGNNPEAAEQLQLVSSWATYGPLLKPYVALMNAETLATQTTNASELRNTYWQAIDSAQEHGYLFHEAHAFERLGVLLEQHHHHRSSQIYLHEAQKLYTECNANQFAKQLSDRFQLMFSRGQSINHSPSEVLNTDDQLEQSLDSEFLLAATADMMKEKNYDALLMKILSLMMAKVGAKNAYLVTVTDNDFIVRVHGRKNAAVQMFQLNQQMVNTENLCPKICRYVIRSQLPVVLGNACASEAFGANEAVQHYQLKSVLALPLLAEGRALGLIYLENALIHNVFSEQEVIRLQVLTTQAAIALDNTLLINNLKQTQDTLERGEVQLKDEQALQTAMLDKLGEAVILIDHKGEIDRFNNSASIIFGYSEAEIKGKRIEHLLHENIAVPSDEETYLSRFASNTVAEGIDVKAERKNGDVFPFHITIAELPLMADEKKRFVASGQDLTTKEQQQAILQRSQRMDALGKLTGGIVHDYNNMLGVIVGFSELLEDAVALDPRGSHYLKEIQSAADRSTTLTSKLLSYSRQKPSQPTAIQINEALLSQQEMLKKTLTVRIQLVLTLEDNVPSISADLSDLENAVLNLCINAMHAMPDGGRLEIKTECMELSDQDAKHLQLANGEYVVISITDNGSGIDQEIQDKMFDPFFSTKGDMGTGLGLSQTYGLMERSNGAIKVDSTIGQGTCLSLYFPASKPFVIERVDESTNNSDESPQGSASILVVDDETAFIFLIREALQSRGYTVHCADNAVDAMKTIKSQQIELVLSDILMPETTGYQLAEQIQQYDPNIIIQLMSGFDDERDVNPNNQTLQSMQLVKPIKMRDLLMRVTELLSDRN